MEGYSIYMENMYLWEGKNIMIMGRAKRGASLFFLVFQGNKASSCRIVYEGMLGCLEFLSLFVCGCLCESTFFSATFVYRIQRTRH